jgi:hypothetical protein
MRVPYYILILTQQKAQQPSHGSSAMKEQNMGILRHSALSITSKKKYTEKRRLSQAVEKILIGC